MKTRFDVAVIGAGVMGCATALFLARGGMRVVLLDRGEICREASGVNAGTLTMQMTRAALIPYALHAHDMWMNMPAWCAGGDEVALTIKLDHLSEQGSIINHFLNLGLFKIEVGARTSSEVDHAFVCEAPS